MIFEVQKEKVFFYNFLLQLLFRLFFVHLGINTPLSNCCTMSSAVRNGFSILNRLLGKTKKDCTCENYVGDFSLWINFDFFFFALTQLLYQDPHRILANQLQIWTHLVNPTKQCHWSQRVRMYHSNKRFGWQYAYRVINYMLLVLVSTQNCGNYWKWFAQTNF